MNLNILSSEDSTMTSLKEFTNLVGRPLVASDHLRLSQPPVNRHPDGSNTILSVRNLNVHIQNNHILKNICLDIPHKAITCIIGPSGCGKTTLLKTFNRLLESSLDVKIEGEILLGGENIHGRYAEPIHIRKKMGLL